MNDVDDGNEADGVDEFAGPLIALLGYKRGTANDVQRQRTLTNYRARLGRKKKSEFGIALGSPLL